MATLFYPTVEEALRNMPPPQEMYVTTTNDWLGVATDNMLRAQQTFAAQGKLAVPPAYRWPGIIQGETQEERDYREAVQEVDEFLAHPERDYEKLEV